MILPSSRDLTYIGIFSAALGLLTFYVWTRFVRTPRLGPRPRRIISRAFVVLTLLTPVALLLVVVLDNAWGRIPAFYAYGWAGLVIVWMFLTLATETIRIVVRGALLAGAPINEERRSFLARSLALVVATAGFALFGGGLAEALGALRIQRVPVRLRRFPKALAGLRIAQISDLHVGPTLGRAWLEGVVAQVNSTEPDLVAITGDLVDGSVDKLRDDIAPLANLRAKYGVFFVTGNHEYYSGADAWIEELGRLNVRVLRNERVLIGEGDESFELAGVDDWSSNRYLEHHKPDLDGALRGWDQSRALVLLAHQPKQAILAAEKGVSLVLSGHTHGGQIFPWGFFVGLDQPFVVGLARERDTWVFVTRGAGYWGPPVRIGSAPEVALLELHPEA